MSINICECILEYSVGRRGVGGGNEVYAERPVTDRGRMAFIDSKLNSRLSVLENKKPPTHPAKAGEQSDKEVQRQPATLGKLMEIDLGDEARSRNVQRTEQARRRLDGEEVEDDEMKKKPQKIRLGPDGKPWRSRKKRRGSEDVKRDKMVEDVFRENRRKSYSLLYLPASVSIANATQWRYTMSQSLSRRLSMMIRRQTTG